MKTKKIILSALAITLLGVGAVKIKDILTTTSTVNTNDLTDTQDNLNTQKDYQKLSVLADKCRGCGKCVKIDPAHFVLDRNTQKARVISSTNLDSKNLELAINNCPAMAIALN